LRSRRIAPGRWLLPILAGFLFLLVFALVVSVTLPGDAILSVLRPALGRAGVGIDAASVRMRLPLSIRMTDATVSRQGIGRIRLDSVVAACEPTGLFRWLPFRLTVRKGEGSAEIRTSPRFWNPGTVRVRLAGIAHEALAPLLPPGPDTGFRLDAAELRWRRSSSGEITGGGSGRFSLLRFPIPAPGSPVREAELRDVEIRFALRGGTVHVPSITGTYEGARVHGTGEISRFLTPLQATVTFHLTIENPLEGRVATLFDLVAKNAKNVNLRITGSLFAPAGEFRFF
jgi:type II secretion system protein N